MDDTTDHAGMTDRSAMTDQISTMRLYGSSIGLVSGIYSVFLATTGGGMTLAAWFMLLLGLVVLIHGIVLLTPAVARLGGASGPLMVIYAVLMLLNQAWLWTVTPMGDGMGGGMGGGMGSGMGAMGYDAGMVAVAVLMLASGVIMTTRREMLA